MAKESGTLFAVAVQPGYQGVASIRPGQPESMSHRCRQGSQPVSGLLGPSQVARLYVGLAEEREEPMDAPRAIATSISDGQASLPDTDCLLPFLDCDVICHPAYVSRHDRVDVHELSSACGLARLRHLPSLIGQLFDPLDITAADVDEGKPYQESWQQRLLMERASEIDCRLSMLNAGIPISEAVGVLDGERRW